MHLNLFALVGTIKDHPKIYTSPKGASYTKFEIEYIRWRGERPQTFKCIAWDAVAKNSYSLLKKGMLISISGILEQNSWINRNNVAVDEVVLKIFHFEMLNDQSSHSSSIPEDKIPDRVDDVLDTSDMNYDEKKSFGNTSDMRIGDVGLPTEEEGRKRSNGRPDRVEMDRGSTPDFLSSKQEFDDDIPF